MKEVFLLSYDGYDEDYNLVRQGFVTMYDLEETAELNKAILEWNKMALDHNLKFNFYSELRKYHIESIEHFRAMPKEERIKEAMMRIMPQVYHKIS